MRSAAPLLPVALLLAIPAAAHVVGVCGRLPCVPLRSPLPLLTAPAANGTLEELERQAEVCESRGDLRGAADAYEALLTLQPLESLELERETILRRGMQELLLESARRELAELDQVAQVAPVAQVAQLASSADAEGRRSSPDGAPPPGSSAPPPPSLLTQARNAAEESWEESRKRLMRRALSDVSRVRESVLGLLDLAASQAEEDGRRARKELVYQRLVEGAPGTLPSLRQVYRAHLKYHAQSYIHAHLTHHAHLT